MLKVPKYIRVNGQTYKLAKRPITKETIAEGLKNIGIRGVAGEAAELALKLPENQELLNEVDMCVDQFEELYIKLLILIENLGAPAATKDKLALEDAIDTAAAFWIHLEQSAKVLSKINTSYLTTLLY